MKKLTYYPSLYLPDDIDYSEMVKIKTKLNRQPAKADVYLITRSLNETDQLDIFHSKYLPQKFYEEHPLYVYGLAKDKDAAISLVKKIVQECVAARGDANLIKYLTGE